MQYAYDDNNSNLRLKYKELAVRQSYDYQRCETLVFVFIGPHKYIDRKLTLKSRLTSFSNLGHFHYDLIEELAINQKKKMDMADFLKCI